MTANVVPIPRIETAPLTSKDVGSAADLLCDARRRLYQSRLPTGGVAEWDVSFCRRYLEQRPGRSVVARVGRRVVGLVAWSTNCVEDLWVAPRYRRRGLATGLVEVALDRFRERGFQNAQCGCEDFNREAIAFLEAGGWQRIGGELIRLESGMDVEALVFGLPLARSHSEHHVGP